MNLEKLIKEKDRSREILTYVSILPTRIREKLLSLIFIIALKDLKLKIRRLERNCNTFKDYYDLINGTENNLLSISIRSNQKEWEIIQLLTKVSKRKLKFLAEIGTGRGGTFYLLSKVAQPDAMIITVDVNMPWWRKRLLESCTDPRQTILVMKADSNKRDTVERFIELLQKDKLDLIFIDGNHSYKKVKQDFLNYSPLVRKGGLITFHDIVPDYRTRYGIQTSSYTGDVPKFWNEIKHEYRHFEIVNDPNQDGNGIGVLVWE